MPIPTMSTTDENLSRVIAHHDAWAATYDSDIQAWDLYNRITADNIRRFLPKDRDHVILDAGGGTGMWTVHVARMGYRVMLTDLSTGMLEKAKEKVVALGLEGKVEIRVSDIRDMAEFGDAQFGMVMCQGDPLSYCGDHRAAVREFARVVRSGGAVLASVDNRVAALRWIKDTEDRDAVERLLATGDILAPNDNEELRYVIHAFTPAELHHLFEGNGISVERIIGKPVLAGRLTGHDSRDPAVLEWLHQLESKYCDDPAFYPWGGHLEIAGRKR
jgi:ubiquinone/menaquinone biosynthesis C-methylase UbiE